MAALCGEDVVAAVRLQHLRDAEADRITHLFVDEPGAFEVSAAPYVLAQL